METKRIGIALACFMLFATLQAAESVRPGHSAGYPRREVIKFYVHDNLLVAENDTAVIIAGPGGNITTPQQGTLVIVDDLITDGPSENSRKLGNAQGQYSNTVFLPVPHIHQLFTAVFTDKYNGTIAYQGDDAVLQPVREIAVVGGTGQFRLAQGYAFIETYNRTSEWSFTFSVETHLFYPPYASSARRL